MQHVSDLHLKIRTEATPCVEEWLRLGEEKKIERKKEDRRNHRAKF